MFFIELYFKFLMVIDSFNHATLSGTHFKGHSLDDLYDQLNRQNSRYISDLEAEYNKSEYKHQYATLKDFLSSIRDYFIDWRYAYDSGTLNVNLNTLSDVLNLLEEYSLNQYRPVSEILAQNSVSQPDGQTMSIDNFDDIKKS